MPFAAVAPEYHRENVLVGQAACRLWPIDPSDVAQPALPADTVAINAPWPAGWVSIGATQEGVTLTFSRSTENITVEESEVPVDVRTTEVNMAVNTTLSEDTFESMRVAFGGGTITTTPATATLPGTRKLVISNELQQFAMGLEGRNEFGFWRRILIPIVLSVADAEAQFRRAAAPRRWNVSFRSLVPIEDCDIREMVAEKTGP